MYNYWGSCVLTTFFMLTNLFVCSSTYFYTHCLINVTKYIPSPLWGNEELRPPHHPLGWVSSIASRVEHFCACCHVLPTDSAHTRRMRRSTSIWMDGAEDEHCVSMLTRSRGRVCERHARNIASLCVELVASETMRTDFNVKTDSLSELGILFLPPMLSGHPASSWGAPYKP